MLKELGFFDSKVYADLVSVKRDCDMVITIRMTETLQDVASNVYTRDLTCIGRADM